MKKIEDLNTTEEKHMFSMWLSVYRNIHLGEPITEHKCLIKEKYIVYTLYSSSTLFGGWRLDLAYRLIFNFSCP